MKHSDRFKIGVLTLSDKGSRGERVDESGQVIKEMMADFGSVTKYCVLPDDLEAVTRLLADWADHEKLDLILTTGGTGLTERDITPEATARVLDREIPGMAEAMRMRSLEITPRAMLSRAIAGLRGRTMIINLPGSPKGVRENLEVVLPALEHALLKIAGDPTDCARQ